MGIFTQPKLGLVLEFYGVALDEVLSKPPPAFDANARHTVARHVAAALRFLHHEAGVGDAGTYVHRDVKPANVLVDAAHGFKAKLTDFGTTRVLSRLVESQSTMRCGVGSAAYMAPELAQDVASHEAAQLRKADVFAFGVLLFDLYCEPAMAARWYKKHPEYATLLVEKRMQVDAAVIGMVAQRQSDSI